MLIKKRWSVVALLCLSCIIAASCGVEQKIKDKIDEIVTDATNTVTNTLANDRTPPSAPVLSAATATATGISLNWTASMDTVTGNGGESMDVPVYQYHIYRNGVALAGPFYSTSFTDTQGLSPSTQYCYTITGVDYANNESVKSQEMCAITPNVLLVVDTIAPSVPSTLTLKTDAATQSLIIGWNVSTDEAGGSGLAGYKVYRNNVLVSSPTVTSFTDSGLATSTQYCYTVSSIDVAGNESSKSAPKCLLNIDFIAPSVVTNVTVSATGSTGAYITWNPSTDNYVLMGYKIYRNGVAILNTMNSTFFLDSGLTPLTQYCYEITAFDAIGNESVKSAPPVCVTTLSATTPPLPGADAPVIMSRIPATNAINVPANTLIKITFSKAMDGTTINTTSCTLSYTAIPQVVTVTYDPTTFTATLTPPTNLMANMNYMLSLSNAITDTLGNHLAATTWSFTTTIPSF